ncbi:hypothetical protein NC652_033394 [Populus alba x Populus x berolinensis]|nr:hypothetical protein NC652_033394 [Populus alba x Populus x berolinensis]
MAGGMFSSSSGTLFGSPRSISSTSSLQLSSKDSSGLHYLQDNKNGCPISASAHMSATAMLKKAAQMGATASNSINSPVMQKSFASSMAGPHDQLSSIKPPTYGRIQQHSTSYATSHHMCRVKLAWLESMALEDLVTSPCKEGHKKPHRYLTLVEDNASSSLIHGRKPLTERNPKGPSMFAGTSIEGGDMMTRDFMWVGGARPTNLHDQRQQHQQRLEMEGMSQQQRMPMMNPFQQQPSLRESAMEKPSIWDV